MAQIKPLNPVLQKIANEELFEETARIPADLEALKLWIHQQPHLRARTDDQMLIQFLRGCKYSLERAKEKIDRFYVLKTKFPDMFGGFDVNNAKFRKIHRLGCFSLLPTPLNDTGCRMVLYRFNYDTSEYTPEDIFLPGGAMYELLVTDDPYSCIQGTIFIMDMAQATLSHLLQLSPNFMKKLVTFYEKSLPLRIKAVYYFNVPSTSQQFFKMLLPLFSEKLQQRVVICGTTEELTQRIPLKYLPKDYGGENGSIDDLVKTFELKWDEYRDYFLENADYGTDESLRPGKPIDFDGMFGVGGSFRKLTVD